MMRVACVQMRSGTNEAANIAAMEKLVCEAAGEGAVYVQTPEMTGIMERDPANLLSQISEDEGNPVFAAAASLARELGIREAHDLADLGRIRKAFASANHPDRCQGAKRQWAEERMKLANSIIDEEIARRRARIRT